MQNIWNARASNSSSNRFKMIFLRIVSKSERKIEQIAELLMRENLVIDVNIRRNVERAELVGDALSTTPIFLMTGKTKAVLFDTIDQLLNELYPNNLPEVYALPIMQMDWKQAENLTKDVQSVSRTQRMQLALKRVSRKRG